MVLKEMFETQKELDLIIINKHNLQGQDLFGKKVLSFYIELAELANELRFFKFWSNKPASSKDVIMEEYADAMHFLISIGNDLSEVTGIKVELHDFNFKLSYKNLTDDFTDIIECVSKFKVMLDRFNYNITLYEEIMEKMLMLGHKLGFTFQEIEDAYYKKHDKNLKRQEENY